MDLSAGPDLGCLASVQDPTAYFAPYRERGPVHWSEAQRGWAIIGHAALAEAFRDSELLSADRIGPLERASKAQPDAFATVIDLLRGWMIFRDPPAHTRLREPVRLAFTPRRVGDLEGTIESIVDEVLDDLAGRVGPVELSSAFAHPIPAMVIGALLGVDPDERHRFQAWSDALGAVAFSTTPGAPVRDATIQAAQEFTAFFGGLVAAERAAPTGGLLTAIAHAEDTDLTDGELVGLCTLLLFAGHETTTTLLANALAVLCQDAELRLRLRSASTGWPLAVDEFLRTAGSARTMVRKVAVDHERGGVQLRARQNVFLSIAAANHDPEVFEAPHQLNLARDPNPHLGFGWGLHHCLGAALARTEARIALSRVVERFAHIELAEPIAPLSGGLLGFGARRLLVHLRE